MTNVTAFKNLVEDTTPLEQGQMNELFQLQTIILEEIVNFTDNNDLLNRLCLLAEGLLPESVASIMMLDAKTENLSVHTAPNLPEDAIDILNGLKGGEGSCGNVVLHNQEMYVCDTSVDARWTNLQAFAEKYNIGACWSYPIRSKDSQVMGSFALSNFAVRTPNHFQRRLLKLCASLASLIFQRAEHIRQVQYQTNHDLLTGLINRSRFKSVAEHYFKRANAREESIALLSIGINGLLNLYNSNNICDNIVKTIAENLNSACQNDEPVCRWNDDQFVVLVDSVGNSFVQVENLIESIEGYFSKPINIQQEPLTVELSYGISISPQDGNDIFDLINKSGIAMLYAKSNDTTNICYYND